MVDKICPTHNNLSAITDVSCHSHSGDLHQFGHNAHCKALECPHALIGCNRHKDVPIHAPRDLIERTVARFESLVPDWMAEEIIQDGRPQKMITTFAKIAHLLTKMIPLRKK